MKDPFEQLRRAASQREKAERVWEQEVMAARHAGFSLRAIADVAGVSHDTIWRTVK